MASGGRGGMGSFGLSVVNSAVGIHAAQQDMDTGLAEMRQIDVLATDAAKTQANQVSQALSALSQTTEPLWANVQTTLGNLRSSVVSVLQAGQAIELVSSKAQYRAAIGTGADFVTIAGQTVPLPVNTILRRELSATQIRYDRSLQNAKQLAYMHRRPIIRLLYVHLV